ncbi:SRPBCC domain-containing protein [Fuerstiella marisgermanici]|uniref:Activator of HSP90 ATPase n=1 Tax=Fuerstiella marisgermanici TaxID=1891926 RepID=A0A1P8WH20_9PLAN|nr:SRPBCC domain-containing protein [Fuerstiella marisgermanici]APZ93348.1 Activator of HSP90 ATPase [Fuerstiella marisgermanici]
MTIEFTVSAVIPASPKEIYDAWLNSDGHTKMTGSPAHSTAIVGDPFDAWDGYISGKYLKLEPGKRIVQSWRGSSYKDSDADSQIEVTFEPVEGGTKITLAHTNVPNDQASHEPGWRTHCFAPMQKYFGVLADKD